MIRAADADMAVGVNDLLPVEDPVGDYKVLDQGIKIAHRAHPLLSLDGQRGGHAAPPPVIVP